MRNEHIKRRMSLLQLAENNDVCSIPVIFDAILGKDTSDQNTRHVCLSIKNLVTTSKGMQTSPLVLKLWQFLVKFCVIFGHKEDLFWSAKRLFSLKDIHPSFRDLYQASMCAATDSLPVVSAYSTSSDSHCILRKEFSAYIIKSGVLNLINRQLQELTQKDDMFDDKELPIFRMSTLFLQRCVGVLNGHMMFLEPLGSDESIKNQLANNLVLLFKRHGFDMDLLHLTVIEALCVGTSAQTLELIFEHLIQLFLSRFPTYSEHHISYLQGCLLRVMRQSFAHKRHIIRRFINENDIIGNISVCLHNNINASVNKHFAGMCVLSEVVMLCSDFGTPSLECTIQCILQCLNKNSTTPYADLYILILRQILFRRTRRICSDIISEMLKVITSPTFARGIEQVMSVIEPLVKTQRHSINIPSCQVLVRYMLTCLTEPKLHITTWVQCLGVLRTFVHQLNRANLITVLEHSRLFVDAMENWNLDPVHSAQILYVFRYVICRLSCFKDLIVDRLYDLGFVSHIRARLQRQDVSAGASGRPLNVSIMRAADILMVHDIVTDFEDGKNLVSFCTKMIIQHASNKKLVVDTMRVLMRTAKRFESRGVYTEAFKKYVIAAVAAVNFKADYTVLLFAMHLIHFFLLEEENGAFEITTYQRDACPQEIKTLQQIHITCNMIIFQVEKRAADIVRNREIIQLAVDVLSAMYANATVFGMVNLDASQRTSTANRLQAFLTLINDNGMAQQCPVLKHKMDAYLTQAKEQFCRGFSDFMGVH